MKQQWSFPRWRQYNNREWNAKRLICSYRKVGLLRSGVSMLLRQVLHNSVMSAKNKLVFYMSIFSQLQNNELKMGSH